MRVASSNEAPVTSSGISPVATTMGCGATSPGSPYGTFLLKKWSTLVLTLAKASVLRGRPRPLPFFMSSGGGLVSLGLVPDCVEEVGG